MNFSEIHDSLIHISVEASMIGNLSTSIEILKEYLTEDEIKRIKDVEGMLDYMLDEMKTVYLKAIKKEENEA